MVAWCAAARAAVEPDERVQLPPAGGRRDAGAGDRLRAGHRDRRARRGARVRPGRRRALPAGVRLDLVLRERRHPLRRGGLQAAGASPSCGTASASSATASPIRRRAGSATACRSTRSGSPRPSPRTTCSASCSRCSRSRCRSGPGPGRSSCRRGTRRSACPRPWDQQWSLRMQQVLAYETDLLEYDDIFDGSTVIEGRTDELRRRRWTELDDVLAMGGAFEAIDELKGRLVRIAVRAHPAHRVRRADRGRRQRVHRDRRRRRSAVTRASSGSTRRSRPSWSPTSPSGGAIGRRRRRGGALDELRGGGDVRRRT